MTRRLALFAPGLLMALMACGIKQQQMASGDQDIIVCAGGQCCKPVPGDKDACLVEIQKRSLVGVPWICCYNDNGKQVCHSGVIEPAEEEPKR